MKKTSCNIQLRQLICLLPNAGRKCSALQAPKSGSISQGFGEYGTTVTFSCSSGYRIKGSKERVCQGNGQWSGVEPACEGN